MTNKVGGTLKTSDNTPIAELDRLLIPAVSTAIDRYVFANHWTKGKTVIDAATGKGYGAGLLLALGAKSVVGIDIDKDGVEEATQRMASPHCIYKYADIFNLQKAYKENEFDVCTSIETFEHLPPERIDEYLQALKHVTKETIIITTPRRKTEVWKYQEGSTHLYEYDSWEMMDILDRNFGEDNYVIKGLKELRMPHGQWGTDYTDQLNNCTVFFVIVNLNK